MSKVNVKVEVESILGRELIGHEKAIVAHFIGRGMMNPFDVATALIERHLEHNATRLQAIQQERLDLQAQMDKVRASIPAPRGWDIVETANEYTSLKHTKGE